MVRIILLLTLTASVSMVRAVDPWINEFHYRPKENMFVELVGPAGQSTDGLNLVFYQGRNGTHYPPVIDLRGSYFSEGVDTASGLAFLTINLPKIHKGNQIADGIALTRGDTICLQFISYGGSFTATTDACTGVVSQDVGIEEPRGNTDMTSSIQLTGTGNKVTDFTWASQLQSSTRGALNHNQVFTPPTTRKLLTNHRLH